MRPVINSEKHYVQFSLFAIASGALSVLEVVRGVTASPVTASHVREGAVVKAVYIEMWGTSDDTGAGSCVTTVEKTVGDGSPMTAAESASLNSYRNKKNIFFTQQGLLGPNTQYPMNLIKGWFKIPKGKQRIGLDDKIRVNILGQSNGMSACGFATYKEYF